MALIDNDKNACGTLRANRPDWNVRYEDIWNFNSEVYANVDLLSAGVPCPPFSQAGEQLGKEDERDLFPAVLMHIAKCKPKAVMIENVKGLMDGKFSSYRKMITSRIRGLGYNPYWGKVTAVDFGLPQKRTRVILIAIKKDYGDRFEWPIGLIAPPISVGEALYDLMAECGWACVDEWKKKANKPGPALVGGSKKHGGPDLGPTRARKEWAELGVEGKSIADQPPGPGFEGKPRLTLRMAARYQGFPSNWKFVGRKTSAYRQIGNAFPPQIARALAQNIQAVLYR